MLILSAGYLRLKVLAVQFKLVQPKVPRAGQSGFLTFTDYVKLDMIYFLIRIKDLYGFIIGPWVPKNIWTLGA